MRKAGILAATMLGATLLAAGPALSDPKHCPPGHAKKGWCDTKWSRDWDDYDRKDRRKAREREEKRIEREREERRKEIRAERHRLERRAERERREREERRAEREREERRLDRARERAYELGYRDAMRDAWEVGQTLPRDRYRVVPDYYDYGWPAPGDGRGYVQMDDEYFLVNLATGLILDILSR